MRIEKLLKIELRQNDVILLLNEAYRNAGLIIDELPGHAANGLETRLMDLSNKIRGRVYELRSVASEFDELMIKIKPIAEEAERIEKKNKKLADAREVKYKEKIKAARKLDETKAELAKKKKAA